MERFFANIRKNFEKNKIIIALFQTISQGNPTKTGKKYYFSCKCLKK